MLRIPVSRNGPRDAFSVLDRLFAVLHNKDLDKAVERLAKRRIIGLVK